MLTKIAFLLGVLVLLGGCVDDGPTSLEDIFREYSYKMQSSYREDVDGVTCMDSIRSKFIDTDIFEFTQPLGYDPQYTRASYNRLEYYVVYSAFVIGRDSAGKMFSKRVGCDFKGNTDQSLTFVKSWESMI